MRLKSCFISVLLLFCSISLMGESRSVERFNNRLLSAMHTSETVVSDMSSLLLRGQANRLPEYTFADADKDILYMVFYKGDLIYWSDNWLVVNEINYGTYDEWHYYHFGNAHCVVRCVNVGKGYVILSVIAIKYDFRIENRYLVNNFADFLNAPDNLDICFDEKNSIGKIHDPNGKYLFSLCKQSENETPNKSDVANAIDRQLLRTFSYTPLFNTDTDTSELERRYMSQNRIRVYGLLFGLMFLIYILWMAYIIYRAKGFKNLRIGYKFQSLFSLIVLIGFFIVLLVSIDFIRKNYELRQKTGLQQKTQYIQKALQDTYFWSRDLNRYNTASLNIYLKDLSYTYKTDIHVYDLSGRLVGSSQPIIFDLGLLSLRMSPKPYFSENTNLTQYEHIGSLEYLSAYTDFVNGDYTPIGYIAVPFFVSSDIINAEIDNLLGILLPIYLSIMLLSIILTSFISKQISSPIITMGEKLRKLQIDQHNEKISYKPHDEIGLLVTQYNQMVDELERSAIMLARSERENAWKTMAQQVAHEIKNPLTPMKLTIQQLQRMKSINPELFEKTFTRSTELLIEQIDNLTLIANEFSYFAKMPEMRVEEVDMAEKLYTSIGLYKSEVGDQVRIVYKGLQSGVWAMSDSKQIMQVFSNLLKNAIQALHNKHDGLIEVSLEELPETVMIKIHDNGPGIPEDIREKVFNPNFTTKSTGMGMGLAITKKIVEESGGTIRFETSSQGTTFFVEFIGCPAPDNKEA